MMAHAYIDPGDQIRSNEWVVYRLLAVSWFLSVGISWVASEKRCKVGSNARKQITK